MKRVELMDPFVRDRLSSYPWSFGWNRPARKKFRLAFWRESQLI